MTMQIGNDEAIAGVSIKLIRKFFRDLVARRSAPFELSLLQEHLTLPNERASALAHQLMAEGYIAKLQNDSYELSDKGAQLARASAAGRIKRKTAEAALAGLLKRAEEYNADENKLLTIDAVAVFGSFLGPKTELGDLDVAVRHRRRQSSEDYAKAALAAAKRSGRHFSNTGEWLGWPETEVLLILKARKRTIQIQPWDSFLRLVAKDPDQFAYKVAFGNPEEVKTEIIAEIKNSL